MNADFGPDVVGIGNATVDHLFVVPDLPEYGQFTRVDQFLRQSGGLVATGLVALAHLGASTRFVSKIGDDAEGLFIRAELEKDGVDTSRLWVEAGALSSAVLVLVDKISGERSFTSRPNTCSPLRPEDLSRQEITSAKVLFLDRADEVTLQAATWAKEAGVWIVLDPAQPFEVLEPLLSLVDAPIVPEAFAHKWFPEAGPTSAALAAECLFDLGARIAVVTQGERGCVVKWEKGLYRFPALPIKVVDTTGAGDAFHGGFIYGLLQGWEVEEIVRFASAVGALNCRYLGGRTGLPTRAEVDRFLTAYGHLFVGNPVRV